MGLCNSKSMDEDNIDNEKDNARLCNPGNTTPTDYPIESVVDSDQNSDGEVVVRAPSNKNNPGHPVQAGSPEFVRQNGHQSDTRVSSEQGQKVNTAETGSALIGDYIEPESVEAVNTGKKWDDNMGRGSMEPTVLSYSDEQRGEVYDSRIGRMVYVLGNNQSVNGLEPITVPATGIPESIQNWERKENEGQQVFSVHQTEPMFSPSTNWQYEAQIPTHDALISSDFGETCEKQMPIVSIVEHSRKGYQHNLTSDAHPVANEPAKIEVYDPMIGEMVQLLDHNAPLDVREIIDEKGILVPVNYEDIPATEMVQIIQLWGTDNNRKKNCGCNSYIKKTYTQGRTLGIGASCRVVACVKNATGKKFALKIMSRRDKENAELFAKEKDILQILNHPNIMTFHEAHADNQNFYIVSVLYEGGELFDRIADLTETRVSHLVRTMLLAIQYCHRNNVVHRDLKPENFVFKTKARDSGLVLIDFGCAKQVFDDEKYEDLVGTPLYLAPESALGSHYIRTGRVLKSSDIWSIGITAYVILTGRPPFNGQSNTEIFQNIIQKPLTFPPEAKLSRDFVEFCQLMLKKSPKRRLKLEAALEHRWIRGINTTNEKVPAEVIRVLQQFKQQSKLKKVIAKTQALKMASHSFVRQQFNRLDKNCDGALDLNELSLLLMDMGYSKKQAYLEATKMIQGADFNGSGEIEFDEFAEIWQRRLLSVNDAYIHAVFSVLDEDGNGVIDAHELGEVLKLTGEGDNKKIAQIIDEVDQDGDGVISWEEFRAAMLESGDFGGKGADIGQVLNENELPSNVEYVDLDRGSN